jgi:hypothetical protein
VSEGARPVHLVCEVAEPGSLPARQALRQAAALRRRGHRANVVAAEIDAAMRASVAPLEWAEAQPVGAAWVLHYDRWSEAMLERVRALPDPSALWFHGFLQPEQLRRGEQWARSLQARGSLPRLAGRWNVVLADSSRDGARLEGLGLERVAVVPPLLQEPQAGVATPFAPVVLAPGPIVRGRGLDELIVALGLVRRLHNPGAELVVQGRGVGQEPFAAGLATLASRVEAGEAVRIVVGDEEDAQPAMVAVDLERNGAFPVGLAGALARGVPAVVLAGSLAAEVAGDGALALPAPEPVLVAEALGELLARPELRADLGEAGRAAVAHLWGAEAESRVVEALGPLLAP